MAGFCVKVVRLGHITRQRINYMTTKKLVPVEDAIGMVLPHDVTEIVAGEKKGPAFRKGHVIREQDVEHLKRIGKFHIYVLELGDDMLHEDDAAIQMAQAISGANVVFDQKPVEGKVGFRSTIDGVLRVERDALFRFNELGEVMLATLHTHTPVTAGKQIAAGRAIPLIVERSIVDEATKIATQACGLLKIAPYKIKKAAIVVTGREVFEGRIEDRFGPVMQKKLEAYGVEVVFFSKAPDDVEAIKREIEIGLEKGAEFVLCTGGMSVDPDDVTRVAIKAAGAEGIVYGSPVLPGAMFLVGYFPNDVPVVGVPACGMYFKSTVLDIVLPRLLAGEKLDRKAIAELGHGGFCQGCKQCHFPVCPFGKV